MIRTGLELGVWVRAAVEVGVGAGEGTGEGVTKWLGAGARVVVRIWVVAGVCGSNSLSGEQFCDGAVARKGNIIILLTLEIYKKYPLTLEICTKYPLTLDIYKKYYHSSDIRNIQEISSDIRYIQEILSFLWH